MLGRMPNAKRYLVRSSGAEERLSRLILQESDDPSQIAMCPSHNTPTLMISALTIANAFFEA